MGVHQIGGGSTYYDRLYEQNRKNAIDCSVGTFEYYAAIEYKPLFRWYGDLQFDDVYVAQLVLRFESGVAFSCGMSFSKERLVVLRRDGTLLLVWFDGPSGAGYW